MKKDILECVERILEAILSTFASVGLFVLICFVSNLCGESLTTVNMGIVFMISMLLVYCLIQALVAVRYERLEILADELENNTEESEKLYEHLKVE